jgi:hypothetical protein
MHDFHGTFSDLLHAANLRHGTDGFTSPAFFLGGEMFQTKVVEKIKTHSLYSVSPPPQTHRKSCRLWGNVEKYCRPGQATNENTIRRMRFACWITKATHTHTLRISNRYCSSTTTTVARTRPSVTLYVQYLSCFNICYSWNLGFKSWSSSFGNDAESQIIWCVLVLAVEGMRGV